MLVGRFAPGRRRDRPRRGSALTPRQSVDLLAVVYLVLLWVASGIAPHKGLPLFALGVAVLALGVFRVIVFDLGYPRAFSEAVEKLAGELGLGYSPAGRVVLERALAGEPMYLANDGHWTPAGCPGDGADPRGACPLIASRHWLASCSV